MEDHDETGITSTCLLTTAPNYSTLPTKQKLRNGVKWRNWNTSTEKCHCNQTCYMKAAIDSAVKMTEGNSIEAEWDNVIDLWIPKSWWKFRCKSACTDLPELGMSWATTFSLIARTAWFYTNAWACLLTTDFDMHAAMLAKFCLRAADIQLFFFRKPTMSILLWQNHTLTGTSQT